MIPGGVILFLAGRVQLWKFPLLTWPSQTSASCFTDLYQNLPFCTNKIKSHRKREHIWLGIKISCCVCCFSTIFCLRVSDMKLNIIKVTDRAKEERMELKISAKAVQIWILKGFYFTLLPSRCLCPFCWQNSSVRLCCCKGLVSNVGLHFLNIL